MKVLFVTRGFPSEKDIMAGNYEAVQAKALAAKGLDVSVMTMLWRPTRYLFFNNRISHREVDGIDIYEFIYVNVSERFRFLRRFCSPMSHGFRKTFNKYLKEKGLPDIVHAHIILYAYNTLFLKTEYNLPFVITEHWTLMNTGNVSKEVEEMSIAYRYADRVICVSQALADSLKKKFQLDSIVIHNMVSDSFFKSARISRNDNHFSFIAIGAFRKNKGFDILVDAFANGRFPENVCLNIVGDGEERELVESKIRTYHLSNQVKLLGTKTPDEVNDLLCHSDCFVLSSRLETFAIVVIEAMAKGLPVIATRSGGPETFLQPEHGLLVEKENVKDLSEAMKYIISHYTEYDSNLIRKYCYEHFSQEVIANQIVNVYDRVLSR